MLGARRHPTFEGARKAVQKRKKFNTIAIIKALVAAVMLVVGALAAVVFEGVSTPLGILARSMGLSFVVAGAVSLFHEVFILRIPETEIQEGFDRILELLAKPGIRMITSQRQGYSGYYQWILEKEPQELFFAGHSVLHRVQADFTDRRLIPVEQALKQQLLGSSRIRILFLDPTWDFIDNIANAEKQPPSTLRRHLAITLGICQKLWKSIEHERLIGEIEIRVCSELVQYAFHHVICREKGESEMLVGFYFAGRLGTKSPLFLIENEQIQEFFATHFKVVFDGAKTLLICSRDGTKEFDYVYYRDCQNSLAQYLGSEMVAELCP